MPLRLPLLARSLAIFAGLALLAFSSTARAQAATGVTDGEVLFGMSAPFSGSARELGRQMKVGVELAFAAANDAGGVAGRRLRLMALDDGYEPPRVLAAVKELIDHRKVFGIIGSVGTPTTAAALPYALEKQTLFFGAFTTSSASAILKYKDLLTRHAPGERPDFVSLEGHIAGSLLVDALKRAGKNLTTDTLIDALESIHGLDLGMGVPLSFGPSEHQASHKVWGTVLDGGGVYRNLDLE